MTDPGKTTVELKLLTEIEKAELQEIAGIAGQETSEKMRRLLFGFDLLLQDNQRLREELGNWMLEVERLKKGDPLAKQLESKLKSAQQDRQKLIDGLQAILTNTGYWSSDKYEIAIRFLLSEIGVNVDG